MLFPLTIEKLLLLEEVRELMTKWQITKTEKDTVEVSSLGAKFIFKATGTFVGLQVFKNGRLIEETSLKRSGHDYVLKASEVDGYYAKLNVNTSEKRIITKGDLNGEKFEVDTTAINHGLFLTKEIKQHKYPTMRFTRTFGNRLRDNLVFRSEIKRHTQFPKINSVGNGTIAACVAICATCALEGAFACLWCVACVESA